MLNEINDQSAMEILRGAIKKLEGIEPKMPLGVSGVSGKHPSWAVTERAYAEGHKYGVGLCLAMLEVIIECEAQAGAVQGRE